MSRRRLDKLKPFDFRSDFEAAAGDDSRDDRVSLAPQELAALGARLYQEGAGDAQERLDAQARTRLDEAMERMNASLESLRELTEALDRLGREGALPREISALAERAAQILTDGQGDLFAVRDSLESGPSAPDTCKEGKPR